MPFLFLRLISIKGMAILRWKPPTAIQHIIQMDREINSASVIKCSKIRGMKTADCVRCAQRIDEKLNQYTVCNNEKYTL
jgi:hypothetical protein